MIHDGLDLDVRRGEVFGIVGGSGTGKSVLLRTIIGLNHPAAGRIELLGQDTGRLSDAGRRALEKRYGVLFQDGALFSSLTVGQNVEVPLREHTSLPAALMDEIAALKIAMVGLEPDAAGEVPLRAVGRHEETRRRLPGPLHSTRKSCSSTSRRPGSTRSARPPSTR